MSRLLPIALLLCLTACAGVAPSRPTSASPASLAPLTVHHPEISQRLADYASVRLSADLSGLDADQKKMLGLLIEAADVTNALYWQQNWGDRDALLAQLTDPQQRAFAELNYGPWDRLHDDQSFVTGIGSRPAGARFYPADMSKTEFERTDLDDKTGLYTLLRRDANGRLMTVPYHEAYQADLAKAAALLREAAALSKDAGFTNYLKLRADALQSDDYQPSDYAWMAMKTNPIDIVIGPIETYDDQLFGYKAAFEAYVLIKDQAWSKRLARFAQYLPTLQRGLPVPAQYKAETPGSDADLNAYFAIYYAGNANVGAKTIAINLPNDEEVQLKTGTRRLQLENVMKAKFDTIMLPIGKTLIAEDQQSHLSFDAFFENTMFHEVAHGLGIKNVLGKNGHDGQGTVREALKDQAASFEEGKADILGLYMVRQLANMGELDKTRLMDNYVTFLVGILRSVRFGAADAHAKANMVRFNFFAQQGAITRDADSGRYRVDFDRMTRAIDALSAKLLMIQGDGDYSAAKELTDSMGIVSPTLAADLKRLDAAHIPVDIRFEQGAAVLGLTPVAAD